MSQPLITSVDLRNRTVTMRDPSGQLVTMDLGINDVHIPSILPAFAGGYSLEGGVADKLAPPVLVPKTSDYYPIWDARNAFAEADDTTAGPGGAIPEVGFTLSKTQFSTVNHVVGAFVPTEVEANADGAIKVQMTAIRTVMDKLTISRERRVANLLGTSTNWDSNNRVSLSSGQKWNGGASSDPVANLLHILEVSAQPVTAVYMNRRVYNAFMTNAQVQKYITFKPSVGGLPSPEQMTDSMALARLPPIVVSDMKAYNKTTGVLDFILPDVAILVHQPNGGAMPTDNKSISSAYTMRFTGGSPTPDQVTTLADGSMSYRGWTVRSFFVQNRGPRGGNMIVATHDDAEVITSSISGGIVTGCIQ